MSPEVDNSEELDILLNLKHIAYCRVHGVPGHATKLEDLIQISKFFLCEKTHTLWKDAIWDIYTDEELLVEYFSYIFKSNEDYCEGFLKSLDLESPEKEALFDWFDEQIDLNQKEVAAKLESLEDNVNFTPAAGALVED